MGLAYSILACALWPLVAFLVPEHQLGTAYGMYVFSIFFMSPLLLSVSLFSS